MDKYTKIPNMISKDACEILAGALLIIEKFGFNNDSMVPEAFSRHGYTATDSLMYYLRPKIEEVVGSKLLPVTSYCRIYRKGQRLPEHIDRNGCEISVTLNLKNDGVPWPIQMDGVDVHLDQGDCAVYRGMEVVHRRECFEGNEHIQVFLHYVLADGENAEWKYDKRVDTFDPF